MSLILSLFYVSANYLSTCPGLSHNTNDARSSAFLGCGEDSSKCYTYSTSYCLGENIFWSSLVSFFTFFMMTQKTIFYAIHETSLTMRSKQSFLHIFNIPLHKAETRFLFHIYFHISCYLDHRYCDLKLQDVVKQKGSSEYASRRCNS